MSEGEDERPCEPGNVDEGVDDPLGNESAEADKKDEFMMINEVTFGKYQGWLKGSPSWAHGENKTHEQGAAGVPGCHTNWGSESENATPWGLLAEQSGHDTRAGLGFLGLGLY